MIKQKYIICDLDGTLFIKADGEPWLDRNFLIDKVIPETMELLKRYSDHCILFVTGRKEKYRYDTTVRLWQVGIDISGNDGLELFMRGNFDDRADEVVKEEIYQRNIVGKYEIAFVLDDLTECCQMWKNQNLFCLQIWQKE